jgi:glutathione S-transferase
MTDITLFGSTLSPFVEKVRRALVLKGLKYRIVGIKSPSDLKRWNPQTGKMPVLEMDGERFIDSTFILRHLDKLHPEPPLLAEDPATAAGQRQLEDWSDESLYWQLMALRWAEKNAAATARQITDGLPPLLRPVAKVMLSRQITASTKQQGFGRFSHPVLLRELGGRLDDLVLMLGKRPFFFADRVSVADLAVYSQLRMACSGPTPDAEACIADRPALADYQKRVEEATSG